MPHRDTSVAIKKAITLTLHATQGNKHWLSIKPLIDIYPIMRNDLMMNMKTQRGYNYFTL